VVTRFVRPQLPVPECPIGGWHLAVSWATVPEAAINKDGQPYGPKDEIWSAWNGLVPSPPRDPVSSHQLRQRQFRVPVASSANAGHHF
jgi:hypothetical protein